MKEGYILKFYREKEGLTQGQLAEGICSITHLSKIERGITEYYPEITRLLSERLNRDFQKEVENYHRLSQRLKDWHEAMIMQRMEEADQLKIEIERDPLKEFPDFLLRYQLLLSRYELFNNKLEQTYNRLTSIQRQDLSQSPYDCHLVKHLLGIYYFLTSQFHLCIECLKAIDPAQYNNQEYYYHLALAYHSIHSNITSYYYAEKALSFFRKTLNMLRIIDTETLMLVELNSKELHDFEDTKQKYEILLKSCDTCYNSAERKSKLYNNYAFECFRRKKDQDAALLYEKAMSLLEKQNPFYLIALDGYLQACNRGKLLPRNRC
jgi:transcriptional regulator with XRE-family HTH domain